MASLPASSIYPRSTFPRFPDLPIEIRLTIWEHAVSAIESRIVHLKQRLLKEMEGEWWERVRSNVPMWPCDKPFEQDELAPWEKDGWGTRTENEYAVIPWADTNFAYGPIEDYDHEYDSSLWYQSGYGLSRPERLWGFSTETQTPGLLLLCRDSREVALKHYQLLFSSLGAIPQISTLFETRYSSTMTRFSIVTKTWNGVF